MKMYQALAAIVFSAIALPTLAQMTPVGVWRSFDEKTNEPKSEVRITENAGVLQGTVQKVLRKGADPDAKCTKCRDALKDQPIVGLPIIQEARKAEASARALFGGGGAAENMPVTALTDADFTDGAVDILTLLVKTGLCSSRGDARRNVEQGGVTAGDEKITDIARTFEKSAFAGGLVLRRGKKNYKKLIVE